MTNDKITPAWVVKNYLPNYEMRLQEWRYGHSHAERVSLTESAFRHENFREALDAFAKSICERQRERCADVGVKAFENTGHREASHYAILSAPMPDLTKNQ